MLLSLVWVTDFTNVQCQETQGIFWVLTIPLNEDVNIKAEEKLYTFIFSSYQSKTQYNAQIFLKFLKKW